MINSTHVKAHRSAAGGKGGRKTGYWPLAWRAQHEIFRASPDAKGRLDRNPSNWVTRARLTARQASDPQGKPTRASARRRRRCAAETNCARTRTPPNQIGPTQTARTEGTRSASQNASTRLHSHIESAFDRLKFTAVSRFAGEEAGAKLPRICLPCRSPCMVDLIGSDSSCPNSEVRIIVRPAGLRTPEPKDTSQLR